MDISIKTVIIAVVAVITAAIIVLVMTNQVDNFTETLDSQSEGAEGMLDGLWNSEENNQDSSVDCSEGEEKCPNSDQCYDPDSQLGDDICDLVL